MSKKRTPTPSRSNKPAASSVKPALSAIKPAPDRAKAAAPSIKATPTATKAPAAPVSAPADNDTSDSAVEQRVVQFAEQLGRVIGTVQAKTDGWLDRKTLSTQITGIRDAAADLLQHVADGVENVTTTKPGAAAPEAAARASRGAVDAPGKKHRGPTPSLKGAKHSDERIAKLRLADSNRQRRSGGGR
jgi:hypothetical protein